LSAAIPQVTSALTVAIASHAAKPLSEESMASLLKRYEVDDVPVPFPELVKYFGSRGITIDAVKELRANNVDDMFLMMHTSASSFGPMCQRAIDFMEDNDARVFSDAEKVTVAAACAAPEDIAVARRIRNATLAKAYAILLGAGNLPKATKKNKHGWIGGWKAYEASNPAMMARYTAYAAGIVRISARIAEMSSSATLAELAYAYGGDEKKLRQIKNVKVITAVMDIALNASAEAAATESKQVGALIPLMQKHVQRMAALATEE
jgi:hypothetical protein